MQKYLSFKLILKIKKIKKTKIKINIKSIIIYFLFFIKNMNNNNIKIKHSPNAKIKKKPYKLKIPWCKNVFPRSLKKNSIKKVNIIIKLYFFEIFIWTKNKLYINKNEDLIHLFIPS